MKKIIISLSDFFALCFHKRNIIIVSQHKVKHVPMSGRLQFFLAAFLLGATGWASYSTGSYMAVRHAFKEQGQALRSVTSARIANNFDLLYKAPLVASPTPAAAEPLFTVSALDNTKAAARIALLESKITEMQMANAQFVQRVRDKTSGGIGDLENIIRQTGLNPSSLKNEARKMAEGEPAEGGPYIPADTSGLSEPEQELFAGLDELAVLRRIVGNLPLSAPVAEYDEQSPFGHRVDPFTGPLAFHSGIDLAGPTGAEIHSSAEGIVVAAGRNGAYGNAVDIDHGFGIVTRYGHLSAIRVTEGQHVAKNDLIGIQGTTGRSTGPHLHYEVRYHDQPLNPKRFLEAGHYVSQE